MSAAAYGQITQAGFGLGRQRLDGPTREDIQGELAKTDRYVHSAEGIQKTGSEFKSKGFLLRMRRAVQCRFHKFLLNHRFLRLVRSRRLFQSASDKTKSKASMVATAEIPEQSCGHEPGFACSGCVVIRFANSPCRPVGCPEGFDPPVTNKRVTAVYDLLYRNALVIAVQKPHVDVICSKRLQ